MADSSLQIKRCTGDEIEQHLNDLARLRIQVFREFPYCYDGDMEYEAKYLQTYANCPSSVIVVVLNGGRVVGASSGIPLEHEDSDFQKPFIDHGYDLKKIFYCAESVLLPEYRGGGLGHRFFDEREAHARELGGFDWFAFCAVERPEDHPRRPSGYRSLDGFWNKRGYQRHPELWTTFEWKDLDESEPSRKKLVCWLRRNAG